MRIKYMFIVQQYVCRATVRPGCGPLPGGVLQRDMWSLTGSAGRGVSDLERRGLSADQNVEEFVR